jgi:hypothetical protein
MVIMKLNEAQWLILIFQCNFQKETQIQTMENFNGCFIVISMEFPVLTKGFQHLSYEMKEILRVHSLESGATQGPA